MKPFEASGSTTTSRRCAFSLTGGRISLSSSFADELATLLNREDE